MELITGILASMFFKLVTGKVISQVMVIGGRAWAEKTVNQWDDEFVEVIADGLGMEAHPMKTRLREQQAAEQK